ncbi:gliding motility-associated C-terminal domain-containing protein [Mangrovimonas xylaniphaga]|uniref:gliding motility-associated C-terminal domain-containing protein n=1 Tax=Mangrovimonas xylaniphaga TaxID=1645915 RepID=UPI0006B3FF8C|nr:gliding motility-associated C-terminal domain-containing protein [Mangrovimonas xylaniphaga]
MRSKQLLNCLILFCYNTYCFGQDISLYKQFNGRYDYTAIGNTLNLVENGTDDPCEILTSSSASLNLNPNQNIIAAYLYWAGSGPGDFEIKVNDIDIIAERKFSNIFSNNDSELAFFAAFTDVTSIFLENGSGEYNISDLDVSKEIPSYCPTGTNFAGWAIVIIFKDNNLPLNQLNVYDGLQSVPDMLSIKLDNLNVLDNEGSKIGFIAWEGDASLAVSEQLTINGKVIGNPPLNPPNNAFNGTNSFTGSSNLYNMDIDVYNLKNNIAIGDSSAIIELTSGQDLVIINNIITVLNNQLPDAKITLDSYTLECDDRGIEITYTVFNTKSTDILPANTPIALYANSVLVGQSYTLNNIPIDGSESNTITILIPESVEDDFILTLSVDDTGVNSGIVTELNEENNTENTYIELLIVPPPEVLQTNVACDEGFDTAYFNLEEILESLPLNSETYSFYTSLEDLKNRENEIFNTNNYSNIINPQTIFVKVENDYCYTIYSFDILVENCPPFIPEGFSPNSDGLNDWFNIQGLYDIFEKHKLKIFNRNGVLIFEGNNTTPWEGRSNRGLNNVGNLMPVGTYYYILDLNDPNYKDIAGWVYVNY